VSRYAVTGGKMVGHRAAEIAVSGLLHNTDPPPVPTPDAHLPRIAVHRFRLCVDCLPDFIRSWSDPG
jgi:hypothetical protein